MFLGNSYGSETGVFDALSIHFLSLLSACFKVIAPTLPEALYNPAKLSYSSFCISRLPHLTQCLPPQQLVLYLFFSNMVNCWCFLVMGQKLVYLMVWVRDLAAVAWCPLGVVSPRLWPPPRCTPLITPKPSLQALAWLLPQVVRNKIKNNTFFSPIFLISFCETVCYTPLQALNWSGDQVRWVFFLYFLFVTLYFLFFGVWNFFMSC